jgi:hypothetical protein
MGKEYMMLEINDKLLTYDKIKEKQHTKLIVLNVNHFYNYVKIDRL